MFHTSVNSKTIMTFSTMAIAAVVLLFASDPILANQKALAANLCGSGLGCGSTQTTASAILHHSPTSSVAAAAATTVTTRLPSLHGGFGFHHFGHFGHFGLHHHCTPLTGTSERQKERGHHFLFFMNSYVTEQAS